MAVVVCLIVVATAGCTTLNRMFGDAAAEVAASKLQELQLKAMRFADEYAGGVLEPVRRFQLEAQDPTARLAAQDWKLSQATAAYTIASGPNPITNSLDLVVLATLSRMVVEDTWVYEAYGQRARPLQEAHRRLESQAWSLVATTLSPTQLQQLREVIDQWRAANPHVRAVSYIHFRDFASSIGQPKQGEHQPLGSLFSLLGIDPLSRLDPAVREIAQTRHLAERTIYYAQRAPSLLDMEVERLTYVLATMPETRTILQAVEHTGRAAQAVGGVAGQLPVLIAREREASIHQFMQELSLQQQAMLTLVVELRGAFVAGTAAFDSVQGALHDLDTVLNRFGKRTRAAASNAPGAAQRPFDITDYSTAARELATTAQALESLVAQLDTTVPQVADLAERTAGDVRALVDFILWGTAALVLLVPASILAAVLAYRLALRRMQLR